MDLLNNSLLRRTLAPQPEPDPHAEPRKRLLDALLKMRERAAMLANEIHRDLPDFTVHDITHLDALWEMADLIAGPDYPLNPLEAFALGAVFLLHDLGLGLAAYPGGLAELKKGPGWQDALSTYLRKHLERIPTAEELASPPPEVERMAVQERLRVLHAEQAEKLAMASWRHGGGPEYHLIDDPDLRQAIGPLLGKIAHSHWWPVSRLGNEFGTVRGALTNCPREWTIDPLKVAALLRTADAAHLDGRRAPGFLIALRRPEGMSQEHWRFQNQLLKPQIADERLIYTTNRPFPAEEVNDWWLCEEILRMVDLELHQVDALLADRGQPPRLRARGVAGVESPLRLRKYVEVSGWTPVDARIHVSNVADLARKMGGKQLYGNDPTIPLRELIQNASDAVRARRLLEGHSDEWGSITVRLGRDDGVWIEIEDNGIGMSEAVLTGPLLDFGTTYWGSELMREEHEGLWAKGFEPTGRFGVGFFSVFMWGHRVLIRTRRYHEGPRATIALEFITGLSSRPLVRPARLEEQLKDGGTCVRVWLSEEPRAEGGLLYGGRLTSSSKKMMSVEDLCAGLAPSLGVDLWVKDEGGSDAVRVVAASDWLAMSGDDLLTRVSFGERFNRIGRKFAEFLEPIKSADGKILGRATINVFYPRTSGALTVGGLRVSNPLHVAGILTGLSMNASRDAANFLANEELMARWATRQGKVIAREIKDLWLQLECAEKIVALGGNPGSLPIIDLGGKLLNFRELSRLEEIPGLIILVDFLPPGGEIVVYENVATEIAGMDIVLRALACAWDCSVEEISVRTEYDVPIGNRLKDDAVAYCEDARIISLH